MIAGIVLAVTSVLHHSAKRRSGYAYDVTSTGRRATATGLASTSSLLGTTQRTPLQ